MEWCPDNFYDTVKILLWTGVLVLSMIQLKYKLGLVSGAMRMMPLSAATRWAPAFVMKFCSVQVKPRKWKGPCVTMEIKEIMPFLFLQDNCTHI